MLNTLALYVGYAFLIWLAIGAVFAPYMTIHLWLHNKTQWDWVDWIGLPVLFTVAWPIFLYFQILEDTKYKR